LKMADLSPRFRESLNIFTKGSLAQAHTGALTKEHLSKTKAAELARANRQERNRRSVQKGGLIYADGARTVVRKRMDNDVHKKLQVVQNALEYAE